MSDIQKFGEEFQRMSKHGFDAAVSSFGEVNKGLQAIAAEITDYTKKAFDDGTHAPATRRKVVRASNPDPVSVRQEGL